MLPHWSLGQVSQGQPLRGPDTPNCGTSTMAAQRCSQGGLVAAQTAHRGLRSDQPSTSPPSWGRSLWRESSGSFPKAQEDQGPHCLVLPPPERPLTQDLHLDVACFSMNFSTNSARLLGGGQELRVGPVQFSPAPGRAGREPRRRWGLSSAFPSSPLPSPSAGWPPRPQKLLLTRAVHDPHVKAPAPIGGLEDNVACEGVGEPWASCREVMGASVPAPRGLLLGRQAGQATARQPHPDAARGARRPPSSPAAAMAARASTLSPILRTTSGLAQ